MASMDPTLPSHGDYTAMQLTYSPGTTPRHLKGVTKEVPELPLEDVRSMAEMLRQENLDSGPCTNCWAGFAGPPPEYAMQLQGAGLMDEEERKAVSCLYEVPARTEEPMMDTDERSTTSSTQLPSLESALATFEDPDEADLEAACATCWAPFAGPPPEFAMQLQGAGIMDDTERRFLMDLYDGKEKSIRDGRTSAATSTWSECNAKSPTARFNLPRRCSFGRRQPTGRSLFAPQVDGPVDHPRAMPASATLSDQPISMRSKRPRSDGGLVLPIVDTDPFALENPATTRSLQPAPWASEEAPQAKRGRWSGSASTHSEEDDGNDSDVWQEEDGEEDEEEEDDDAGSDRQSPSWQSYRSQNDDVPSTPIDTHDSRQLPESSVRVLQEWLLSPEHFDFPWPTDEERKELSERAGITQRRLGIWLTNARKRLWAPLRKKRGLPVLRYGAAKQLREARRKREERRAQLGGALSVLKGADHVLDQLQVIAATLGAQRAAMESQLRTVDQRERQLAQAHQLLLAQKLRRPIPPASMPMRHHFAAPDPWRVHGGPAPASMGFNGWEMSPHLGHSAPPAAAPAPMHDALAFPPAPLGEYAPAPPPSAGLPDPWLDDDFGRNMFDPAFELAAPSSLAPPGTQFNRVILPPSRG